MLVNQGFSYKIQDKSLFFTIQTSIYPLKVISQTAYYFLDKVYVFLEGDPAQEIEIRFKSKTDKQDLEKLADEFHNELLNQLLRNQISDSNAKIREYIVAQALYNAVPNEVDELLKEVEQEDWQADPLGIAKPWEDKETLPDK